MTESRVRLAGITKRFGPVVANDDVDLELRAGEVHAVVGENGAGKSTLMSVLYGSVRPDSGQILARGTEVSFDSPRAAIAAGIGMVHQHFQLFESMSVTDNVIYGAEPTRRGLLDRRRARERVAALVEEYGSPLSPTATVGSLPMGLRQQVEILKALYRGADVLILDEPTAVLTPAETTLLFTSIRRLAERGTVVALVTHKLDEVMQVSDRVTVLRQGKVVAAMPTTSTNPRALARAMTGRDIEIATNDQPSTVGAAVLEVTDLRTGMVHCDELVVRAGEIVGIAGVAGNGQSELVQATVGLRPSVGSVRIAGRDVSREDVRGRRAAGLAYVPEDRGAVGSARSLSVQDNLAVGHYRKGWLKPAVLRRFAADLMGRHDVRGAGPDALMSSLSGGNAQKVVLARELEHRAPLLVAENPTQGVDVGAIEYIHRELLDYRAAGHGVLLVSNELSELIALADRVHVMVDGRFVAAIDRADLTEQRVGEAMTNATEVLS
ncbi:ABC transporter ATP-binding protein [Cryptosporangium aurantiacum]|uniref:Nucleoside ABC transporter ATP-binding protein n=1 Tax=Cryptosporangium aurantiacum TaxID=134849 RepID=A0A1M7KBL2_9ACTN|nr:ABC transporter ATP-binding protein [Cryptosporangium aurantiacum]SHM62628.1 nucleoside ABC transporter ATP-binding protein [Cryptosporangium aurantiacum]